MSGINGGVEKGCSWEHRHGLAATMRLFDRLPRPLRDYLNGAPTRWCTHCVRQVCHRYGAEATIAILKSSAAGGAASTEESVL